MIGHDSIAKSDKNVKDFNNPIYDKYDENG
jgi:hypothetical protein